MYSVYYNTYSGWTETYFSNICIINYIILVFRIPLLIGVMNRIVIGFPKTHKTVIHYSLDVCPDYALEVWWWF